MCNRSLSPQLVEETDHYWLLSFVPTDDDDEDDEVGRRVLESMQGTVKIIDVSPASALP